MFIIKSVDICLEFTKDDYQYALETFGFFEEGEYNYEVKHNAGSDYWEIDYLITDENNDSCVSYVGLSMQYCEDAILAIQNLKKQVVQESRDFKNE